MISKSLARRELTKTTFWPGLVYSVCLNYLNRVKGPRRVGKKIFMQGGVCYNKAVPVAMASLMKAQIVVPPDPGLMGAYGVALETVHRINLGISAEGSFDLEELISRPLEREGTFVCGGGSDKCDRKCEIARFRVAGKSYPFGGACDKYYNLRLHREVPVDELDLVAVRDRLCFVKYGVPPHDPSSDPDRPARTVGIMRSFVSFSLYPLYSNFFSNSGSPSCSPNQLIPREYRGPRLHSACPRNWRTEVCSVYLREIPITFFFRM